MRRSILALLLAMPVFAAMAQTPPPRLNLPLDCRLGESCWIINYPDVASGPEAKDLACRPRTYDGHDGTDFAVRDVTVMNAGVLVLAAAAGKVLTTRDGEPDGLWMNGRAAEVKAGGKECGNRVAIAHGNGWVTDYCHLRKGSVQVKPGDAVAAGQPIGQVGLSGMTEFPHVHMSLQRFDPGQSRGTTFDPSSGHALADGCGQPAQPAWTTPLPYQSGYLYAVGFSQGAPNPAALKAHADSPVRLPPDAPVLMMWGALFGAAAGDRVTVTITAPSGDTLLTANDRIDKDYAWRMVGAGKKRGIADWPPGTYQGTIVIERDGIPPQRRSLSVEVR